MAETTAYHALGLHMHQPPGNLRLLIDVNPREAEEIVKCYERVVRYAERYADVARIHVSFSGVLLEQLIDPDVVSRYRGLVDLPEMLARYRECSSIELVGMGYYHPIFPLIPRDDWLEQLERGRAIMERVFDRAPCGFWPPEMALSIDMIPAIVQAGYQYMVVDGVHVHPDDGVRDPFRPYVACHEGFCLTVVPQDRDMSQAQSSGMDPLWLRDELAWRVSASPRPDAERLLTTWSDGENGGWLRQMHEASGFFGRFFAPCMEACRTGTYPIQPVLLSRYLKGCGSLARAELQSGTWSGGCGGDVVARWTWTAEQRRAVEEVRRLSQWYWRLCREYTNAYQLAGESMVRARRLILEAETSCFLCWGDAWLPHLYARTLPADDALRLAETVLRERGQGSAGTSTAE